MKRYIALILAAVLCLSLFACGKKTEETEPTADPAQQLVILYTNDVHCGYAMADPQPAEGDYTMGYAALASYADDLRAEGKTVVLVDGGDALQGDDLATRSRGGALVDMMNQVGYSYAVPGEHDMDYGVDNLKDLAKNRANYTYLCCNMTDAETGESLFSPYAIMDVNGVSVAFLGITSPATAKAGEQSVFYQDNGTPLYYLYEDQNALYQRVQDAIDLAYAEGAQYVVGIGHLGTDPADTPWTSTELIAHTTGLTMLLDGRSHTAMQGDRIVDMNNGEVPLISNTDGLKQFARADLNLTNGDVTVSSITRLTKQSETVTKAMEDICRKFSPAEQ